MQINSPRIVQISMVSVWFLVAGCAAPTPTYDTRETVYTPTGTVESSQTTSGGRVISELKRQFENTKFSGTGAFTHINPGLARRSAVQLAVADLASKVELEIESNTVIRNNQDVRDEVRSRVHAIVQNYEITFDQYDTETRTHRIEVAITGKNVVREVERMLRQ